MKKILLLLVCSIGAFAQINTSEIQIVRDKWGVPHIFAKTDAQVAYGLAWAHAEDDFETIQLTVLAGKGMLGQYKGKAGALIDYVVGLLRTKETAKQHLNDLSPDFRKVVEGYVAGLNAYALAHPKEVFIKKAFPANVEDFGKKIDNLDIQIHVYICSKLYHLLLFVQNRKFIGFLF